MQLPKFSASHNKDFSRSLSKRVNNYFKENNLSRNANNEMKTKTWIALSLYVIPFLIIVFGGISNTATLFGLFILMGIAKAIIGTGVMHDALHGSYSKNPKVNQWVGYVSYLIGVNALNWKIQHNVKHHTFTNIEELDEDLDPRFFMRFSPHQTRLWFHRYQHVYASLLYCFTAMLWVLIKDPKKMVEYNQEGYIKPGRASMVEYAKLILHKSIYFSIIVGIPLLVLPQPAWLILLMIVAMYAVAGFILSSIFQLAHVMPGNKFVAPGVEKIEENRMVHQLQTTSNFGMNSKLLTWFCGGLNFQIEHHLFPNVCHVHYPQLSQIVQETANEYGIEYNSHPSFLSAYRQHLNVLQHLGSPA
jgi:linoleoyl-CoA desaturase